ncbi:MAG: DUF4065 domain-containing protein [Acidobacteriota bacterium]|nr:DUF4065 domain-containing protein [Acidobacteriota bacterium]
MKLQKLVYYAHGWNLAISNVPLINECVEAWEYGPVIPSIYHAFKRFGSGDITEKATRPEMIDFNTLRFLTPTVEDQDTIEFLKAVWDGYGDLSAIQLSNLTHQPGTPWSTIYAQNQGRKGVDIPDALIREYFVAQSTATASHA